MQYLKYIIISLIFLSLPFSALADTKKNAVKIGGKDKIIVSFDDNDKKFAAQYRDMQIKGDDMVVSIMFINMSSDLSPDIRLPGNKHTKIRIDTYFKNNNTIIASKSVYPIDFYYQQEGYVRAGNSIPLYIHSGSLTKKQLESINTVLIDPQFETK